MARRFKGDSRKKSCKSTSTVAEINEDGILQSILSSLTIRDAVRTSVLSSRWRHLWTYLPNLDFSHINMFGNVNCDDDISKFTKKEQKIYLEERADKFVGCVNKFLQNHQGRGVKTLSVAFFLHKKHADHLDKWVDFGITSGAHDLSVVLLDIYSAISCSYTRSTELYDFPCQLFAGGRGSSIERLCLCYCALRVPPNFDGFHSLKALELQDVDLEGGDLQGLLSTCSTLESLTVRRFHYLVDLSISNPSGKLKYLCVNSCSSLKKVDVYAINLTTFEYTGHRVRFLFRNALQLTRVYFDFVKSCDAVNYVLTGLQDDLPHLETLIVRLSNPLKAGNLPVNSNVFTHLKHLVMNISRRVTEELLWVASILSAAPLLEEFELNRSPSRAPQPFAASGQGFDPGDSSLRGSPTTPPAVAPAPVAASASMVVDGQELSPSDPPAGPIVQAAANPSFLEVVKGRAKAAPPANPLSLAQLLVWDSEKQGEVERRQLPTCTHGHLKTIKITGFTGIPSQIEFALYMLNNAISLELMTISSRKKSYHGNFKWDLWEDLWPLSRKLCTKISGYLLGQVPRGAKLVIQ